MSPVRHICSRHGCGELVTRPRRYCPAHDGLKMTTWTGEWRRQRKKALERDDYRCSSCDAPAGAIVDGEPVRLEVHHANEDPTDHSLGNLVTLCQDCHVEVHHGR